MTKAIERDREARFKWTTTSEARELLKLLIPREHEVLGYVLSGIINKQIGLKLNIAVKTVKTHRGHIMQKLHADSVADFVRLAEKAGVSLPNKEPP